MDAAPRRAPASPVGPPAQARYYVPLPRRMLLDLRDTPLAIGVYALLARTYRRAHAPVPLSPADLIALDGSLSAGAATRALRRLRDAGYLIVAPRGGRKTAYAPAWGLVRGAPVAWDLAAACLGRPRHLYELRLPQELLDACLGQIQPHPHHAALVARLVGHPLLTLRDIGSYALASAGLPAASPSLESLGLLRDGQPLPVPPTATILAVATQRAWGDSAALTPAGWAQTAFPPAAAPAAPPEAAPLFFVPADRVGHPISESIAQPIGQRPAAESPPRASEYSKPPSAGAAQRSQGSEPEIDSATGGGADHLATPPEPEGRRLLRSIGVNVRVANTLADAPPALVAETIALARRTPGVRDLARWVVGVLRDGQARGWPAAPAAAPPPARVSDSPILFHPDISGRTRQIWLARFRAAEPAGRQAILDRFVLEVAHALPT